MIIKLIFTIFLISGCASASSPLLPLESRSYDVCEDCSGFCWQYNRCVKKFLGICTKSEVSTVKIEAEFKDKKECKTLYDMNFILKVRQKPI